MLIKGLDHIVLTVADIETSMRFYERALGLQRENFTGPQGQARFALRFGEQKINLQDRDTDTPTKAGVPTRGSADICFVASVPLDQVIEHLRNEEIKVEAGPVPRQGARGPLRSIYIRDPDNNLVEIGEYAT